MAISPAAYWRVRIGGSDTLCSGVFDPSVVGAGTDYTEQDSAQLVLTDLTTSSPYTTVGSATGGFTTAMIGNGIYIPASTGFTAGRYIITAVPNSNSAVVDRACATATATGGVGYIGGALASVTAVKTTTPYFATAGNVVFIRGQGSNEPIDIDYNSGTPSVGDGSLLTYIGYNGRPKIGHNGKLWWNGSFRIENFYFVQTANTNLTSGIVSSTSPRSLLYNCVIDQAGFDAIQVNGANLSRCSLINTGSQVVGTRPTIAQDVATGRIIHVDRCLIKDQRYTAIKVNGGQSFLTNNIIQNCGGIGIDVYSNTYPSTVGVIDNNTIYDCKEHGIAIYDRLNTRVTNNIIANITGAGFWGLYVSGESATGSASYSRSTIALNDFYGNTKNCNIPVSDSNLYLDPQFYNAPIDLTPTNPALRTIGGVGAL